MSSTEINNNTLWLWNIKTRTLPFLGKDTINYEIGTLVAFDKSTSNFVPKADNLALPTIGILNDKITGSTTVSNIKIIVQGEVRIDIVETINSITIDDIPTGAENSYYLELKNTGILPVKVLQTTSS